MRKKTFIRTLEFWVPDASGSLLELGGGLFGKCRRFEAATRNLCFGRGEGLPGQAWEAGHPVMLTSLQAPAFRRAAAAQAEGLTCAIALPVWVDAKLKSVTVLFCGDDQDHAGAIELWHNDPEEGVDLTLDEGYYGTTGDTFEFLSRSTAFRAGTGLPGLTWAHKGPVFMPDLGRGSGFLRADSAVKVGINQGLGLPCASVDGKHYVLAMLSALATPLARRIDVWEPDALNSRLAHSFGFSEDEDAPADAAAGAMPPDGGAVEQVVRSGVPQLHEQTVLLPVGAQGEVRAVMGLTL
jgi:hypothetical protein